METSIQWMAGFLQLNFLSVVTILFMGFFLITNHKYEPTLTSFFRQMFYLLLALLFVSNLDYRMTDEGFTGSARVLVAVAACNLRVIIVLRLITIMDYNISGRIQKALSLPMLANTVVLTASFFTDLVIWYDHAGTLHTGPFGYMPHICVGIYSAYALYLAYKTYQKSTRTECCIIVMEIGISMAGVAAECLFGIRGMMTGTIALDMVFYYLYVHICKFYRDPLTGTLNRASFYADSKQYASSITAVYSIDLNGLKQMNDDNGHEAGDVLLREAACRISSCLLPGCYLYRTGGDEFVILCVAMDRRQVQKLTSNLFDVQQAGCDFAFGMHEFTKDVQATFRLADDAMYLNKKNGKAARSAGVKKNPAV